MGGKRALIVDDSRSARTFLARMLEKHELEVDSVESAEQAIDYLGRHHPDVIFMDHLMPGMDGFQAVQSIKNNPRTAMIPIMMYTSQEGELYLGQARALGAVGVLPKSIKPADVSRVLYQLKLLPDRRATMEAAPGFVPFTQAPAANESTADTGRFSIETSQIQAAQFALSPELRGMVESVVREQMTDLRRWMTSHLDEQTVKLGGELRSQVREVALQQEPPPPRSNAPWWLAAAAVLAALAAGIYALRANEVAHQARLRIAELENTLASQRAESATLAARNLAADRDPLREALRGTGEIASQGARVTQLVPYGAVPLSGERLEGIRTVLGRLAEQQYRGEVQIATYPGRFCLTGNAAEGYSLAPEETLVSACDVIGNPFLEGLSAGQRESLAFANTVGRFRGAAEGALRVDVIAGQAEDIAVPYPPLSDNLLAGQWNRAAEANNRVEIRLRSQAEAVEPPTAPPVTQTSP
ncbi:MAG: response regulator [Steroidobacteraceae bacterium]